MVLQAYKQYDAQNVHVQCGRIVAMYVYLKCNTKCAHTVFSPDNVPVVGVVCVEGDMEVANVPKQQ